MFTKIVIVSAALLLVAGCSKEEPGKEAPVPKMKSVSELNGGESKNDAAHCDPVNSGCTYINGSYVCPQGWKPPADCPQPKKDPRFEADVERDLSSIEKCKSFVHHS